MRDVPERSIEPREDKPVHTCDWRNEDFGDEVYLLDGQAVCEDCFIDWLKMNFRPCDIADELGIEHMALEDYEASA